MIPKRELAPAEGGEETETNCDKKRMGEDEKTTPKKRTRLDVEGAPEKNVAPSSRGEQPQEEEICLSCGA